MPKLIYYNDQFNYFRRYQKTWQVINNIIKPNANSDALSQKFVTGNTLSKNNRKIVNGFSEYFANVELYLATKLIIHYTVINTI